MFCHKLDEKSIYMRPSKTTPRPDGDVVIHIVLMSTDGGTVEASTFGNLCLT
jgi:hypothetical protein